MRAVGFDISKWQAIRELDKPHGVDFTKLLEIADFLFLRAGYAGSTGGAWTDERVHAYMKDLETMLLLNPIPFSFYWYFRDDVSTMDQANRFSAVVNRYKEVVNLPLILDAEVFVKNPTLSTSKLIDFQTEVERQTGLLCDILYARGGQLNTETVSGLPETLPFLFIARYDSRLNPLTDEPWEEGGYQEYVEPRDYDTWLFWQHSDTGGGKEAGVYSYGIDKIVFNGTTEELRHMAELDKPIDPPIDWDVWGQTTADKQIGEVGPGATALFSFAYDVSWQPQILTVQGARGTQVDISLSVNGMEIPLRKTRIYSNNFSLYTFQRDFTFVKGDGVVVEVLNPSTVNTADVKVKLVLEKYGQ